MPVYEYKCAQCGRFEVEQPIKAVPLEVCPECGEPVQKLIARNVGVVFKGSGFYTTDNRKTPCEEQRETCGKDQAAAECAGCCSKEPA
jgi:putative FmdB family regulatory protein